MTSLILILISALFFNGIIIRVKSVCAGRKGPGVFQPIKDVVRLFRKGAVYGDTTGPVFRLAPAVYFASVVMAILAIPFGDKPGIISFNGDFVFFAYVLALGKFFCIIGALDTGSSFEGMGASREALYSMLAEPAFFLILGSLGLMTGNTSFVGIFANLHLAGPISWSLAAIAAFVFLVLAMVENSRMPVDDPKTHLELTMIHEVMVLDNSGIDLGLIFMTGYLKFAMYAALIANLFIGSVPYGFAIPLFLLVQIACAVLIGINESFTARYRMNHNPQFIFTLACIALLTVFGVMLMSGQLI